MSEASELIDRCVHCGFCLPTCPTYQLWGEEMDSPRGRIVLMDELESGTPLSAEMAGRFDNCLGCLACVTACPSGVEYDALIEHVRPHVEAAGAPGRPLRERLLRRAIFALFPHPRRLRALRPLLPLARLAPGPLGRLAPPAPPRGIRVPAFTPAHGERRGSVALLQGCVQRVLQPHVNAATVAVLAAEGYDVHAPEQPGCCGALHHHSGLQDGARVRARDTIAALAGHDHVVVNAAGCGSAMKEYDRLLPGDPEAAAFAAKVKDVLELLGEVEARAPRGRLELTVAYHDACHLAHAQGVRAQPRALLRSIPGLELREIAEPDACCGSAGIYNLVRPRAAAELGARKAEHVRATGASALAAANPGCLIQLAAQLPDLRTYHPIELLAKSIEEAS